MKKMMFVFAVLGLVFAGSMNDSAMSGEVDILINKLVEKGILNPSDARQLIMEMQKESARQEDAVKRVASETATDTVKKEAKAVESKIPKWVQNTSFKGDFRLRYQYEQQDNDGKTDRDRYRFRWRVGADSQITDQWKAGFRLASGGDDPRSTNQTFTDTFSSKGIRIDEAYATYKPFSFAGVTGGKMPNPLWEPKDLIWDTDITPEGFAIQGQYELFPKFKVFWNPAAFILQEYSNDSNDSWMLVVQPGIDWGMSEMLNLKVALSRYMYYNVKGNSLDQFSAKSNTRVNGVLVEDFDANAVFGELAVKLPMPYLPYLAFFGEYIHNVSHAKYDTAWLAGFKFGHSKVNEFGQWQVVYNYRDLKRDAIPDFLPDSDFRGGSTNGKGSEVELLFGLAKHVTIGLDYYNNELNDKEGGDDQREDLVQVDMILKW
jgi:polyhydroxyalkanoate synthesis regulator phasin